MPETPGLFLSSLVSWASCRPSVKATGDRSSVIKGPGIMSVDKHQFEMAYAVIGSHGSGTALVRLSASDGLIPTGLDQDRNFLALTLNLRRDMVIVMSQVENMVLVVQWCSSCALSGQSRVERAVNKSRHNFYPNHPVFSPRPMPLSLFPSDARNTNNILHRAQSARQFIEFFLVLQARHVIQTVLCLTPRRRQVILPYSVHMVPLARKEFGTSTYLAFKYSAMNLPKTSYVAFAVTPLSRWS